MKKINKYSRRKILKTTSAIAAAITINSGFPAILRADNNNKNWVCQQYYQEELLN